MLKESKQEIIELCKKWVETFIIGLNLCPFAKTPFVKGRVRFVVYGEQDLRRLLELYGEELELLEEQPTNKLETTLVIVPALGNQTHFSIYVKYCQEMLVINQLEEAFLIVPFHPLTQHMGYPKNAPNHFTGKAPYPIVHILRKPSVDKFGTLYQGDVQIDNDIKLRKLGRKYLIELWREMVESM